MVRRQKVTVEDLAKIAEKLEKVKQDGHGSVLIRVDKHQVCHISYSIGEEIKAEKATIE